MKKILIVEDEEFLIDAYQIKLKNGVFITEIARDGEEAIKLLDTNVYDLCLLDLILPRKNGMEVLAHIRNKSETKNLPVIVASNIDKKETFQEAIKLGANDYYIKSDISLQELLNKIMAFFPEDSTVQTLA